MGIEEMNRILTGKSGKSIELEDESIDDNLDFELQASDNTNKDKKLNPVTKAQPHKKPEQFTKIISVPDRSKEISKLKESLDDAKAKNNSLNQALEDVTAKLDNIPYLAICPKCHDYFNYAMSVKATSEAIGLPTLITDPSFKCSHCDKEFAEVQDLITGETIIAKEFIEANSDNREDNQDADEDSRTLTIKHERTA